MGNNGNGRDGAAQLERHEFSVVARGLDKDQVSAFIDELTRQRDEAVKARDDLLAERGVFLEREQHLASFQKLAEKTVMEADKLAAEIRQQAESQAREQAAAIKGEAERQAQARSEEILSKATVQAKTVYDKVFSQLKNLRQQVIDLDQEFEQKLPRPETVLPADLPLEALMAEKALAVEDDRLPAVHEKEIEIDILPPVDAVKITKIMDYLENLPEIEVVELIPRPNKPSIIVFEKKPIHLVESLRKLAVVGRVTENTSARGDKASRRKLEIVLAA